MAHHTQSVITFHARPEAIGIEPARTAVIVVDMQNDFGSKGGMFDLAGIDISVIQKVIAPTAKVLASARNAGLKIVYLKMGFRPDLSDLGAPDSPHRMRHLGMGSETAFVSPTAAKVEFWSEIRGTQILFRNSSRTPTMLSFTSIVTAASMRQTCMPASKSLE